MLLLLPKFDNWLTRMRRRPKGRHVPPVRVEGFDRYLQGPRKGRALVAFHPHSLLQDSANGRASQFNPAGAALEMARCLNTLGLAVDMIDHSDTEFEPSYGYSLVVVHANRAFGPLKSKVGAGVPMISYSSGCYWKAFIKQSEDRYSRFCKSRGIATGTGYSRPIGDEEASVVESDAVICLGQRTRDSFLPHAKKVFAVDNAAYPLGRPVNRNKHWTKARRNFLYYGSTGNIQKGLDLLIEAFSARADCSLNIVAPLEPELLRHYRRELSASNIHFCHHLRFFPGRMRALVNRCAYNILCGFNSGQSTALIASLGEGMIPVVNAEADIQIADGDLLVSANSPEAVSKTLDLAVARPADWLAKAAERSRQVFDQRHTPPIYRNSFSTIIRQFL